MQGVDGSLQGGEGSSLVRLHVGGLGPAVISSDLLQTFSRLVHVSSVDVVRSKGRSFAYVTIQAAPHDINRLFSLYNGCMWKGGCLKLEKAREFYMDKLHREWEERDHPQDQNESKLGSASPTRIAPDLKKSSGFNIYFPRLRKVKKIPEKGLGKHKRSFQRVESLPHSLLRLCNCDQECMTTCSYQSLAKKEPSGLDREEFRQHAESVTVKTSRNEAIFQSQLSYSESGKKGNKVFKGQPNGGDEWGSDEVPIFNITGLESNSGRDKNVDEQASHKEEALRKVDRAIHGQRKRRKVEQDSLRGKEDGWHGGIDEGTDQMLQGEELTGFSRNTVGRSWVQKAPWKSLVGGTGQIPFSLGSVLEQAR
ncbi:hypothetical protein GOP47_0017494 [Adiantum capillus-veneris]|uniref:RRM domain-containing protein n=1 Tax=Adiantum capillus-veneris TaxID=13818 RepID=A0A9D4UFF7_ADICA|nr:hypothetical protein GOP47_0017494 [Adiantum capillus-veneris]